MKWRTGWMLFCICLISSPLPSFGRRSSSGGGISGGGFNRGSSGARQQASSSIRSGSNVPKSNSNILSKSAAINSNRPGSFQTNNGFSPNQNRGGFNSNNGHQSGGFNSGGRPAGGVNSGGGFRNPPPSNFGNQNRGFSSGNGVGSASRASGFKHALVGAAVGAAGGILLYEGTKAIIRSASSPFNYGNRDYYWGEQHYKGGNNEVMCSMPFDQVVKPTPTDVTTTTATPSDDNSTTVALAVDLSNVQFKDGSRPKNVVWGCKRGAEVCCGLECCPAPPQQQINSNTNAARGSGGNGVAAIVLGVIFAILLALCCCCCLSYMFCRSMFDCICPQREREPNTYNNVDKYDDYPQDRQQYPMQQYGPGDGHHQGYPQQGGYPQGAYPPQGGGYPSHGGYPNQYPPNPTY